MKNAETTKNICAKPTADEIKRIDQLSKLYYHLAPQPHTDAGRIEYIRANWYETIDMPTKSNDKKI